MRRRSALQPELIYPRMMRRSPPPDVVFPVAILFIVVGVAWGIPVWNSYFVQSSATAAFYADRNCCADRPATVLGLYDTYRSRTRGGTVAIHHLSIGFGAGDEQGVELSDNAQTERFRAGQRVTIRLFHGDIISVTSLDGDTSETTAHPDAMLSNLQLGSVFFVILIVGGAFLAVRSFFQIRQEPPFDPRR
jgi:hypothetical protein